MPAKVQEAQIAVFNAMLWAKKDGSPELFHVKKRCFTMRALAQRKRRVFKLSRWRSNKPIGQKEEVLVIGTKGFIVGWLMGYIHER